MVDGQDASQSPHGDECEGSIISTQAETTERVAIIQLNNEAAMRNAGLRLSGQVFFAYFFIHIVFAVLGMRLELPAEITQLVWVIVTAPWVGAAGAKVFEKIGAKISGTKE